MTADTLTKDQSLELMQAEIERLREGYEQCRATLKHVAADRDVKESESERLRAAMEVRERDHREKTAEIERLRDAEVIARTTQANLHEEIERLRGLVYAYPPSEPYAPDGVTWQQEAEEAQRQSCQCGEDEACKYVQEIERLRGLLREGIGDIWIKNADGSFTCMYEAIAAWHKRVREALGE